MGFCPPILAICKGLKYNAIRTFVLMLFVISFEVTNAQLPWGATAPDFTLNEIPNNCDPNGAWGTEWNLYSELNDGKHVIVDFSTTWCHGCWLYHNAGILESLWNSHGPNANGDNTIRVFFIEIDEETNVKCLCGPTGCNNITKGNWTANTTYPIFSPIGAKCKIIHDAYNLGGYPSYCAINAQHKTVWFLQHESAPERPSIETWRSWLFESFELEIEHQINYNNCSTTIDIEATGGRGTLSYKWSNGKETQDISGLLNGNYEVTVTDENGYFLVKNIEVNADYNDCPCLSEMNVDLSSDEVHTVSDMLQAMGLKALTDLCNPHKKFNILLGGTLILDSEASSTVCLNDVTIGALNGSKIVVNNNTTLEFKNSTIYGCDDELWEGISLESGSKIIADTSVINNAMEAINAEKGAYIEAKGTIFSNNTIGLYLSDQGYGSNTGISLENCIFSAKDISENDIFVKSIGISINGQTNVNINSIEGRENTFKNLHYGIFCTSGNVNVSNAIFHDLYLFHSGYSNLMHNIIWTYPVCYLTGNAIVIFNSNITESKIENNKFSNLQYAIWCTGGSLNVYDNYIYNSDYGILAINNAKITGHHNDIFARRDGVCIQNCLNGSFSNNNIYPADNAGIDSGIKLFNTKITLTKNKVFGSNSIGIHLLNASGNIISINSVEEGINSKGCFVIENSEGNTFTYNTIKGNNNNKGYFIENSYGNTFGCHEDISNTAIAFHFSGMCDNSKLEGNKFFSNNGTDIVVGDPNSYNSTSDETVIGPQGDRINNEGWGNYWFNNSGNVHHSGTEPIIQMSPFLVNATVDPGYMPKTIVASGKWFYNESEVTNIDPCPAYIITDNLDCQDVIAKIRKLDTMKQMNICTKIMWQYKYFRILLEMKKLGLLSPQCEQWLKLLNLNTILQVVKISKAIDSLNAVKIDTANWFDNIGERDNISRAADSIRLVITKTVLVDSCLKVMNKVNVVRLNQIVSDTLTQADIEVLKPIATACPSEKGEGVYWARGMMSMYDADASYPAYQDCIVSEINPRSDESKISATAKMNIFPNPASGMATIALDLMKDKYGEVVIMDINGNLILKSEVDHNTKNIKIDTNTYIPGIYLLKYSSVNGKDFTAKLVITK